MSQRKKIKYEEEDVRLLITVLIKSMEISTITSFYTEAIVQELESRNLINRKELDIKANRLGAEAMLEIRRMLKDLELEGEEIPHPLDD